MGNTDTAWETWGRIDPYYGVVSHENFRKERIAENRIDFFATGREFVADKLARCEQVFGPLPRRRALDFGCGVGRLTLPLAEQFESVIGLDISSAMLAEAARNADAAGHPNVVFERSDDELSAAPGEFSFVNSYIVLQHIPIRRGMRILRRLVDKVEPGGGFALHLSVHTRGPAWRAAHWLVHHVPLADRFSAVAKGRPWSEPAMQMNGYPLQAILVHLAEQGIDDVYLFNERHGAALTFGLIGRRPD